MNIYLLTEDGETFCIKAKTMFEAVKICEESYIDDMRDEPGFNLQYEKNYYNEQILQSCRLIGQLKN